ncbi:MAG: glycerol kinase GlpK [Coriobacteriaceae bacterium]|nr:glycerol kinase GlpK [Coriobacteriaceae bacterium]
MAERFVIALDQGTTSSRAVLVDRTGTICGMAQFPFKQLYPQPGWVEHDPQEILSTQISALINLMVSKKIEPSQIDCIGITNQRETTVVWDRQTGIPIANAIVWQCRRTADAVAELSADPAIAKTINAKTGLIPDAYFSVSKIRWLLDNTPGAREAARANRLAFGTIDTWLLWSLTRGEVHATDVTNASRTMLYNIHEGGWDDWLLELFDIPVSMMPEVRPSSSVFGQTAHSGIPAGIPICGVVGDQQAALFGQCCFKPGQAKNTYGTGCFLLMHTGFEAIESSHRLITTIAASPPGTKHTQYALEGSVFVAGALIQWLRDELGIVRSAEQTEQMACSVNDTAGVYIVPAFTGLGAPYWDPEARGLIYGLTRGTRKAHIVRAALESMAFQVYDLVSAMEEDAHFKLEALKADGGASRNDFLMQFQSNLLQVPLARPTNIESTALGAAFLAGLSSGFWQDVSCLEELSAKSRIFHPEVDDEMRWKALQGWADAIRRTLY